MNEAAYYESLKHNVIPKLLEVIEECGVDTMHAEHIPMFLEKAIKHSNFEQSCTTKFKAYPLED